MVGLHAGDKQECGQQGSGKIGCHFKSHFSLNHYVERRLIDVLVSSKLRFE